MDEEVKRPRGRPKGIPKTGGRPKGSRNKITSEIKDMIVIALDESGGVDYLKKQAIDNPNAFLTLVGKVLPLQVTGANEGPIQVVSRIELVPLKK